MLKSTRTLLAAALSAVMALGAVGPTYAVPMPALAIQSQSDVTKVEAAGTWQDHYHPVPPRAYNNRRSNDYGRGRDWHGNDNKYRRWDNNGDRYRRENYRWGGDRRYYRHDSSRALVPLGAFVAGALIAGAASRPAYQGSHADYCASRYRTYRASDNTYQPTSGPRRQCR